MQTQTVRTTIDLDKSLAMQLKKYTVLQGLTQKQVVRNALIKYMNLEVKQKNAEKLWEEIRKIAKTGIEKESLIVELRKDRNR